MPHHSRQHRHSPEPLSRTPIRGGERPHRMAPTKLTQVRERSPILPKPSGNGSSVSAWKTARAGAYPPIAAMRRTIHVMYVLRVMPRRRASLSMNSATPSSRVKPARTLLPEGRISGMETS